MGGSSNIQNKLYYVDQFITKFHQKYIYRTLKKNEYGFCKELWNIIKLNHEILTKMDQFKHNFLNSLMDKYVLRILITLFIPWPVDGVDPRQNVGFKNKGNIGDIDILGVK